MIDLAIVVEGETEQGFVGTVLKDHLEVRGIRPWATLPGRGRKHGGVGAWEPTRGDIVRTLKQRTDRYVTTMFDFYGMPHNWPGRPEAAGLDWRHRGSSVEEAMAKDVRAAMGGTFRCERFIPYVQVHEFEALLFSKPEDLLQALGRTQAGGSHVLAQLQAVRNTFESPEAINDDPKGAPSKLITAAAKDYRKPTHGRIAAERTGIAAMREVCPNFDRWVARLEALGA